MIYIFCMLAGVIFFCFGYMARVALEEHEEFDSETFRYDETEKEKPIILEPVPVEKKERKEKDDDVDINYFYQ